METDWSLVIICVSAGLIFGVILGVASSHWGDIDVVKVDTLDAACVTIFGENYEWKDQFGMEHQIKCVKVNKELVIG